MLTTVTSSTRSGAASMTQQHNSNYPLDSCCECGCNRVDMYISVYVRACVCHCEDCGLDISALQFCTVLAPPDSEVTAHTPSMGDISGAKSVVRFLAQQYNSLSWLTVPPIVRRQHNVSLCTPLGLSLLRHTSLFCDMVIVVYGTFQS